MTRAYYNEIDHFAAQWLRVLIKQNLIAPGDVDTRSIEDVHPEDLNGYTQCHFFAGIGVWSYALRRAGWDDDRPVWTGSCPCPPFSSAGKKKRCPKCGGKPICHAFRTGVFRCTACGHDWNADERHLWPEFRRLIIERRPDIVFGEQVAGADGEAWLDVVSTTLEVEGYACGSAVTAACGFGAPHQRKRLYWVGSPVDDAQSKRGRGGEPLEGRRHPQLGRSDPLQPRGMADANATGERVVRGCDSSVGGRQKRDARVGPRGSGIVGSMAEASGERPEGRSSAERPEQRQDRPPAPLCDASEGRGPTNGFWRDADWLGCRDGKWRPVEPAFEQMANGVAACMGHLRLHGKAPETEALNYACSQEGRSCETLRAVRDADNPQAVWWAVGRQVGFLEASVLLASLCQQAGKLGAVLDSKAQRGAEELSVVLREVWQDAKSASPPHGWGLSEQFANKLADLVRQLPQTDTLAAISGLNGSPLVDGAPARVGRLRGYGNAIVAQQAQAFVEAYAASMEEGS